MRVCLAVVTYDTLQDKVLGLNRALDEMDWVGVEEDGCA